MNVFRVTFIGEREIFRLWEKASEYVSKLVNTLLTTKERVEFYVGQEGDFDRMAAWTVKRIREETGAKNCSIILVPHQKQAPKKEAELYDEVRFPCEPQVRDKEPITKRNEWMIDQCDLSIFYVTKPSGDAFTATAYAHKRGKLMLNLAIS